MRRTLATFAATIISLTFLLIPNLIYSVEVEKVETISLENTGELNIIPRSFCKTENDIFLIPDHVDGVVKVFQKSGNTLTYLDKFGPGGTNSQYRTEFQNLSPSFCFYNSYYEKFGFLDVKEKKVYIFNKCRHMDFTVDPNTDNYGPIENVRGSSVILNEDGTKLVIAGYTTNKEGVKYELYSSDLTNNREKRYLVSMSDKYGVTENELYELYFDPKYPLIPAIGPESVIDIQDKILYFMWKGDLRVIKIDLETGKQIQTMDLKEKAKHYTSPLTIRQEGKEALIKAYIKANKDRNGTGIEKTRKATICAIRLISVTEKGHMLIVFRKENRANDSKSYFRFLAYNADGKYLGATDMPDKIVYQSMWLDKDSFNIDENGKSNYKLYSFSQKGKKSKKEIFVYNISL